MKEPIIMFIQETGETHCILEDKNKSFTGSAYCHPEDMPFANKLTGSHIALTRAYIEYLCYLRNELMTEIKTLKHFYSCIEMHKDFNKEHYTVKSLLRTINKLELELSGIRSDIKKEKDCLKTFVKDKNALYRNLESRRAED